MPELLLEVGTEELPASFVERAYTDLRTHLETLLTEAGVLSGGGKAAGTPRRLIVSFPDVLSRQPDVEKESRGPSLKASFDDAGNPTQALLGFCRGQGVDVSTVRKDETYVWVTKKIEGKQTAELLKELLPKAIRLLTFEKSMRWGSSRMRFARPIRWLLAAYDGQVVEFDIEGVQSGITSCGHRFYAPQFFTAVTYDSLLHQLREHKVEPDPARRRDMIVREADAVAGGKPDLPEGLVDENAFLTEWPTAIRGSFHEEYLELPEAVLVIAMAKHEKMFPIRGADGNLKNDFVFVRNSGEDDSVRKGCEWVLNARFNDAKFFFDEDRKRNLDDFLAKTEGILFQQKLGTVRQRAERLSKLAGTLAELTGCTPSQIENATKAGLFCKADLSTGLVGELPALQGIVGGHYARLEGFGEDVCHAIATHYDLSKNAGDPTTPAAKAALCVLVADQIDKLGGYLGLGLAPSGSSDPYALRRAATLLIEVAWAWSSLDFGIEVLVEKSIGLYAEQGIELDAAAAKATLADLFASRYSTLLSGVRHDVLEAGVFRDNPSVACRPRRVRLNCRALQLVAEDSEFVQTATRPINIVAAAKKKGLEVGTDDPLAQVHEPHLESVEGLTLKTEIGEHEAELKRGIEAESPEAIVATLLKLVEPVKAYFDSTMIMAEQSDVRFARLTLAEAAARQFFEIGDVTKLVIL